MSHPTFPPPPPRPVDAAPQPVRPAPAELRPVVGLLLVNLALSILLTVGVLVTRTAVIRFQLDHRGITDPQQRALLQHAYSTAIWGRVVGNLVASIVYTFLVRALLRGKRWAYRRVLVLSVAGIAALLLLWATPYPAWVRVEQVLQTVVLGALLFFVTRPEVKAHCVDPGRRLRP